MRQAWIKSADVVLDVPDVLAAEAFYTQKLGFVRTVIRDEEHLIVQRDGVSVHIRKGQVREGGVTPLFVVKNAGVLVGEMQAHGVKVETREPIEPMWGKEFVVRDAFGYSLIFMELPARRRLVPLFFGQSVEGDGCTVVRTVEVEGKFI